MDSEAKTKYLTLYHVSWCGHCTRFLPLWEALTKYVEKKKIKNLKLQHFDYEKSNIPDKFKMEINGYPTLVIKDGNNTITYEEGREPKDMVELIKKLTKVKLDETKLEEMIEKTPQSIEQEISDEISEEKLREMEGGNIDYKHKYMKYKHKYMELKRKHKY